MRRIARAQLGRAVAALEGETVRPEAVHDARKRIKKVRGLLRLVRPVFPDYAAENRALRDAAREIAGLRDSEVLVQTFDTLIEAHADELDAGAVAPLRAELTGARSAASTQAEAAVAGVRETLGRTRGRAKGWFLSETGFDAAAGGVHDIYRRVRHGAGFTVGEARDTELHEWRKSVKDHGCHVRLMRELWPAQMRVRREALDALGAALGDHQDLAVFEARLHESGISEEATRVVQAIVERRKLERAVRAKSLGGRLAADRPKALVRRWHAWWDIWRAEEVG